MRQVRGGASPSLRATLRIFGVVLAVVIAAQLPAAGSGSGSNFAPLTHRTDAATAPPGGPENSGSSAGAPTGSTSDGSTYEITFAETGLPAGTNWTVYLNGPPIQTSTRSINFTVAPQEYAFLVTGDTLLVPNPSEGFVNVTTAAVVVPIAFRPGYPVTFSEEGLPVDKEWDASLNGTFLPSVALNATSVTYLASNGTYRYSAETYDDPCVVSPITGTLAVPGHAVVQPIDFISAKVSVRFQEFGLPSGTTWSVTLGGVRVASAAAEYVEFSEPCGSYSFSVGAVAGYVAGQTSGVMAVNGPTSWFIEFFPSPGFIGYVGPTGYYVVGALAAAIVGLIAAGVLVRIRR